MLRTQTKHALNRSYLAPNTKKAWQLSGRKEFKQAKLYSYSKLTALKSSAIKIKVRLDIFVLRPDFYHFSAKLSAQKKPCYPVIID